MTSGRGIPLTMPKKVRIAVSLVMLLASISVLALASIRPAIDAAELRAAICICALSLCAHLMPYQRAAGGPAGSIAFIPILASVFLAPHWITAVAVAFCVVSLEVVLRRTAIKALFNVAQHVLSASLAVLLYVALGGRSVLDDRVVQLIPMLGAALAFMACNSIAVSMVVSLSERRNILQVWKANTLGGLPYDLLSLPIVYAFARVYADWGATGALMLAIPLLGIRQLYKTNWLLEKTNRELLELMVAAIEARDPYTSGHSRRVARNARIIARAVGLPSREVERISIAALLHDVGKIHEIFAPILRKPGRLTSEEQQIMESHPAKSVELIRNVSHLQDILPAVQHHHENWDGTGYPSGIAGELIPLGARIIRFADTIDAMTSDRPYRAALGKKEVRAELVKFRGAQFDPTLCDTLLSSALFAQLFEGSSITPLNSPAIDRRMRVVSGMRVT